MSKHSQFRTFKAPTAQLLARSIRLLMVAVVVLLARNSLGVIRDGGIDPANLGKGEWIFSMRDATNKLGGHIASVTNEVSLMKYYKSIGLNYLIIKIGTGSTNYTGCSYASPNQVTSNLCNIARTNGIWIFGYTRSYGNDIAGEIALANYNFNAGADGFIWDAEAEWESNKAWIGTNGPTLAWELCSTVRSNWPNKFLAHSPFAIIGVHSSFPYKEFGYWCDAVMPQIYHFSNPGLTGSVSACINWSDVSWRSWQNGLYSLPLTNINGASVNWTNAIKPIVPIQDVYGSTLSSNLICNGAVTAQPNEDVMEFMDYLAANPNPPTVGGYKGANFFRADLHSAQQYAYIAAATPQIVSNIVNTIVLDDGKATVVGAWTAVRTFAATTTAPTFYGETLTETNTFGTNYWRKAQGVGTDYMQFRPTILAAGDYNVYQWHPSRGDASAGVPYVVNHAGGSNTVLVNQQVNFGNWTLLGRFPFAAGTNGTIRVLDNFAEPTAVAMVDGVKLVFVPPVAVPSPPNGLTALATSSSQINLVWNDNSTNETSFLIARSTTNGGPYLHVATLNRNSTNYSDTGLNAGTTYYYVVRGTNYLGASVNSSQASATTLAGVTAPSITAQPQSQSAPVGTDVSFSVTATGSGPLFYQWRFGTNNVQGATANSYTRTNAQLSHAGNYSVVVSNAVNSVTSSNAVLSVTVVPPNITAQPQNQTVYVGATANFSVTANGPGTLTYQWRFGASNLAGATLSTLSFSAGTNNAGNYDVVITNPSGSTTSQVAVLSIVIPVPNTRLLPLWSFAPGSRSYLTTNSTERGLAYNPATGNLLLVSRAGSANIYVLNSTNGFDLHVLNLGSGVIAGGTFALSLIGVADDGAVYAGNLSLDGTTTNFQIYRWANDNSATTPTVAFSGNPSPGIAQRWGDTFDVRGAGINTQILIGSRTGTNVSIFKTSDGINFTANPIVVSDVTVGSFGLGIAFGQGDTFWGKANGVVPLRQVSFNLTSGLGTVIRTHGSPGIANSLAPIGIHPAYNLLAGIAIETPDHVKLFDLNTADAAPILIETNNFSTDNDNSNGTGAVDFGDDRVFALDSNNGIAAMQITSSQSRISSINLLPDGSHLLEFSADRGQFFIQGSIDLASWLDLANISNTNGVFNFTDPQTNLPFRFYRTRANR